MRTAHDMAGRLRNSPWVRTQSHMALSQYGVCHRLASKVGLEEEKKLNLVSASKNWELSPTSHFSTKLLGIIRFDFPVAFKDFPQ